MTTNRYRLSGRLQRGVALLEFAILAPLLLLLILAMVDLSLLLWAHMTLQYAVREGARYAVVDHGVVDANPSCSEIIGVIQDKAMGLTKLMPTTYGCSGAGRGQLTVLKVTASWPLFTPYLQDLLHGPQYQFSVAATMQNEEH
jgi:Flp pilus assembly protein TadG